MDFMLSGLVVDGQSLACHTSILTMKADSTFRRLDKKTKEDIKRERNRESSARSRQRKKDEDERNLEEINRLKAANRQLEETIEGLLEEGRVLRELVHPYYLTHPICSGCYKDTNETGEGSSAQDQDALSGEDRTVQAEGPGSSVAMEQEEGSGLIFIDPQGVQEQIVYVQDQEWQGSNTDMVQEGL